MKRDLDLLYEVGTIRRLQRTWKQFFQADFQNIPEHTYRMMWVALTLAKHEERGDTGKIAKMVLVHDLPESRTGDTHYVSRLYNEQDDGRAVSDSLKDTAMGEEMNELYREYKERKTIEAQIVKDADTLDVDLEIREQTANGVPMEDVWLQGRRAAAKSLYTKSAAKLFEQIYSSDPHNWHVNGVNRMTSGDYAKFRDAA